MPVTFLHFRLLDHTPWAMNAAVARAPVQICDVKPEQPIDFLCKKIEISDS